MAKKVFYNRRYKMPAWGQAYAVWGVIAAVTLGIVFFTSVEKIPANAPPQLATTLNGFAEGLFYELRDAEADAREEILAAHVKRLEKKHGFKTREEKNSGCKVLRITKGPADAYAVATTVAGEKTQAAFALLTFLDRVPVVNAAAALDARLIFGAKGCDSEAALSAFLGEGLALPVILTSGEVNPNYDRIPDLKNLKLRRYFEQAFFTRERTLWANTMSMLATDSVTDLTLPVKGSWADSPQAQLASNPLLRHPAADKGGDARAAKNVALYLGADYQLHPGGFIALSVLFWLLALLPFVNALGTFRERLDFGSAMTSAVLYGFAFFGYLLLLKLVLNFAKSDFAVTLIALFLLPVVFIPVRILQRNLLRAELNRAGLHMLVLLLLIGVLFLNPILAFYGMAALIFVSGFSRADIARKILRVCLVFGLLALFFVSTQEPLGTFVNFLSALLPAFSVAGIFKMLLAAFIGGNLVSLLFVPRERV